MPSESSIVPSLLVSCRLDENTSQPPKEVRVADKVGVEVADGVGCSGWRVAVSGSVTVGGGADMAVFSGASCVSLAGTLSVSGTMVIIALS
jgi:hypothetical protein